MKECSVGFLVPLFLMCLSSMGSSAGVCPATGDELYDGLCCIHIPILQWATENYVIRIDDLGHGRYRYAAWDSDENQGMEPNIVLLDGFVHQDGSCGNHHYQFDNEGYSYIVDVWVVNEYDGLGELRVYHEGECLLSERFLHEIYTQPM